MIHLLSTDYLVIIDFELFHLFFKIVLNLNNFIS